jgi:hypothetical protein
MMASHAMILLFLLLRVMLTPLYAASAFHLLSSNSLMLFYIFRFRMYVDTGNEIFSQLIDGRLRKGS